MKKKLLAALLAMTMVLSLTACGEKDDTAKDSSNEELFVLHEADLEEYMTLAEDYDVYNLEIDEIEVTEVQVDTQVNNLILDKAPASEALKNLIVRDVQDGDTVVIDYVGTKDGVAFEGGTSYSSTNLTIGSGTFIPGFEESLIGAKTGETTTIDVTFPEDYGVEDLNGQEVQFEVTIHYIMPTNADITDDNAAELYEGCTTVAEVRNKVENDIYEALYTEALEYAVLEEMENKVTYKDNLPKALIDVSYDNIMANLSSYASYYGMDLETYIYFSYYQDLETFQNETAYELAEYNVEYLLYCQAYANEKGLNVTEEELNAELLEYAAYYGYDNIDEAFSKEEVESITQTLMNVKVMEHIMDNANVTMVTVDTVEE